MSVALAVESEAGPLGEDRKIFGLLQLDKEDSAPDGVQHPWRHICDVAAPNIHPVQQAQEHFGVLAGDPRRELLLGYIAPKPHMHLTIRKYEPRLGLAMGAAEMAVGESRIRMCVHGEPLAGIQQFDQQSGVGAKAVDVGASQPGDGVSTDCLNEGSAVGKRRQPEGGFSRECRG